MVVYAWIIEPRKRRPLPMAFLILFSIMLVQRSKDIDNKFSLYWIGLVSLVKVNLD